MSEEFVQGTRVRVATVFKNDAGTAVDPTAVLFKYKDPEGTVTAYTYGVGGQLVKDSVGNYHVDIDADQNGKWHWRFYSTGSGKAADEGEFTVKVSPFGYPS